ncbi:MAG: restriction endonuclease subunit S, partial [Candidatus Electrothrix sp. AR1]|nr:restriction endonuclease subunit S [Candidatus Electrothrix sp. AR1]
NVLFSIDERLKTKKKKFTQTKTLKKALMHDLLTGKKRVKVGSV